MSYRVLRSVQSLRFGFILPLLLTTQLAHAALEEVIVTAQKRSQDIQDVSIPVSAFSNDRLEINHVISLEDLQYIAPSMSFGHSLGFAKIFIRGIGLNDQTSGDEPSVALHVDGAVINDPKAHFTSMFDLERVEVLRGPQGILYGRNATGGSINLITAKPTRELEGYVHAGYGDYNQLLAEAAVSGPLSSWISGRVAYRGYWHDGYSINEKTGHDVENAKRQAARVHLLLDFTDNVNLLLTGEYYQEDDQDLGLHFKRETFPQYRDPTQIAQAQAAFAADPSLIARSAVALAPLGLASCCSPPVAGGYPVGERNYASEFDPQNDKTTWAFTSTLTVGLSDHFTIKNITNYREVSAFFSHDFDMSGNISRYDTNGSAPTIQSREDYTRQFSNEFQILFQGDRLTGLLAVYNFREFEKSSNRSGASPFPVGGLVPGLTHQRVYLSGDEEVTSASVFGNLTYNITPQWAVKLGARLTSETHTVNTFNYIEVFVNPPFTPNPLSSIVHFRLPLIPGVTTLRDSDTSGNFSPMAGLEWRPTDDLMAFYTFSEGFKSSTGQIGTTASGIAKPETIQNHEFGIKSSWLDNSLNVNVNVFYYTFKNLQLARTIPAAGGGSGFVNLFENAAKTTGTGFEAETNWQATDRLFLSGALTWQDVTFDEFNTIDNFDPCSILVSVTSALVPNGVCTPQVQSFAGNSPRNTPEWAFNVHGEYSYPVFGGMLTLSGDVSYKDKQYFTEANNDVESADSYTLFDASLRYTSPDEKWYVTAWGKNLSDELVAAGSFSVALSRTAGTTFLPPRTFGVTAGYNF